MKHPGVTLVGLVLALGAGVGWLLTRQTPERDALRLRSLAVRTLVEHVRQRHPQGGVLVVSNPFAQRNGTPREIREMESAGVQGAARALGAAWRAEMVGLPALTPEAEINPRAALGENRTTTPMSFLVAPGSVDKLLARQPNCTVVISLIGLPAALDEEKCWGMEGAPHFGLLLPDLRMIGNAAEVKAALKRGKLAAFVAARPGAPGADVPAGSDDAAEFAKRFLLVTPENVEELAAKHAGLLPESGLE